MGTAVCMSSEQAVAKPVDRRTDIGAFGCVLYEMLSGKRDFVGESASPTRSLRSLRRSRSGVRLKPLFQTEAPLVFYLLPMRRFDEAVAATRKAVDVDPLSPFLRRLLGYGYAIMQQYDYAIEQCRSALELDPNYWPAYLVLGQSYIGMKKPDEAIRTLETARQLVGFSPLNLSYLNSAYAAAGQMSEVQKCLSELEEQAQKTYVPAFAFAFVYGSLGNSDACFEWLEKAVDERDPILLLLPTYPFQNPAHPFQNPAQPRYKALLKKMNMEP